jgi:hypothetical protein
VYSVQYFRSVDSDISWTFLYKHTVLSSSVDHTTPLSSYEHFDFGINNSSPGSTASTNAASTTASTTSTTTTATAFSPFSSVFTSIESSTFSE